MNREDLARREIGVERDGEKFWGFFFLSCEQPMAKFYLIPHPPLVIKF